MLIKDNIVLYLHEQFEGLSKSTINDYKFYCFSSTPKLLLLASDRNGVTDTKFDFYDMNFNHLDIHKGHPNSPISMTMPKMFDEMKILATQLAVGIPFVRVDFYQVEEKIYFGEMTFYPGGGFSSFSPKEWNRKIGDWIKM